MRRDRPEAAEKSGGDRRRLGLGRPRIGRNPEQAQSRPEVCPGGDREDDPDRGCGEQQACECRPREHPNARDGVHDGVGRGQLLGSLDERREQCALRRLERSRRDRREHREREDGPDPLTPCGEGGHRGHEGNPDEVGGDHHAPARQPVRQEADPGSTEGGSPPAGEVKEPDELGSSRLIRVHGERDAVHPAAEVRAEPCDLQPPQVCIGEDRAERAQRIPEPPQNRHGFGQSQPLLQM